MNIICNISQPLIIRLFYYVIVLGIVFFSSTIILPQSKSTINILEYGAVPDGITLNTSIIQKAVDEISLSGGGTIFFPTGKYLTGSIELKSNVEIYISKGALILGSTNLSDYFEKIYPIKAYNNFFLKHSLFYAESKENISIRGEGIIDGQGSFFKVFGKERPVRYMNRPYILRFALCKNVRVEGISLRNSASWTQHYFACDDVIVKGIKVWAHANKNNDMIDIDGCKNFIMSDCFGDTDDDAITLKSTSERVTENITITNCVVSSHCNAVKLGTESTGGFKNINISNIIIKPSESDSLKTGRKNGISGISVEMVDGGILDGVNISNVIMEGPDVAIFVRLGNRGRLHYDGAPKPPVGILRNVWITNVIAKNIGNFGSSISGIPDYKVENIFLKDIFIESNGEIQSYDFNKLVEELVDAYPEATMFGILPSKGFYLRHCENVHVENVTIKNTAFDLRPVLVLDDVSNSWFGNFFGSSLATTPSFVDIINSQKITLENLLDMNEAKIFLKISGTDSKEIVLKGYEQKKLQSRILFKNVQKSVLKLQ